MVEKYILYFDDTGSRDPDQTVVPPRRDSMDCFGLGGVLIKEEDIADVLQKHSAFCETWKINYPLHSSQIRGGRGKFGWLKQPENAGLFMPALQEFLLSVPMVAIACIIDRPGYVARYREHYDGKMWYMCKTAFCILAERAAKFADERGRKLEIFFEETGKKEARDLIGYLKELKGVGSPFNAQTSNPYTPLAREDYVRIILGEPRRKTKKMPMIQMADLVLYPMAKGGYDPTYHPYQMLKQHGKLIDCFLEDNAIPHCGIKYSCFDGKK